LLRPAKLFLKLFHNQNWYRASLLTVVFDALGLSDSTQFGAGGSSKKTGCWNH
jgi:hypothetical protein